MAILRIFLIIIYTLSDLGDLSNLISSLSRTIQQYSPPCEWIMCELGFFPIFERTIFQSGQNPRVDFFKARKDLEGLCSMDCLQLPFICVEEAFS